MGREPEGLHDLSFLRVTVGKENVDDGARIRVRVRVRGDFAEILQAESDAQGVAHAFAQGARAEGDIPDAGFDVSGESVRCAKCIDDRLRGGEALI